MTEPPVMFIGGKLAPAVEHLYTVTPRLAACQIVVNDLPSAGPVAIGLRGQRPSRKVTKDLGIGLPGTHRVVQGDQHITGVNRLNEPRPLVSSCSVILGQDIATARRAVPLLI